MNNINICVQDAYLALHPQSKIPVDSDWPNSGKAKEEAIEIGGNIGLLLGAKSGIIDVDLDCRETKGLADLILPKPFAQFDRGSTDSGHYIFKASSYGPTKRFIGFGSKTTIVELRADGAQTMIPPSVHPDGTQLTFKACNEHAEPVEYSALLRHVSLLAAASEITQYWTEGRRHNLALGFAGLCIKADLDLNLIMQILQRICSLTNDVEEQDRLNAVRFSVNKAADDLAGFSILYDLLGYEAAKRIADRVDQYAGKVTSTSLIQSIPLQSDILELGQFADRANITEAKMGIQFAEWLKDKAVYVIETKQWMIWNGCFWEADLCNSIQNLAYQFVQDVKLTLSEKGSINDARELSSFESLNRLQNISAFASTRLSFSASLFDADPMILATRTDWVNLETGTAHAPDPKILISKASEVNFGLAAACPQFEQFVTDIFEGNSELISFVRRAIGYSLTGSTSEQCPFIMIGDGANGKSTFINVIKHLIGTYGTTAAAQTLIAQGGSSIGDDLVDLARSRFISVSETEEGQSLAEAKIKQMTGGDTLKGRPLYGSYVEFKITGKLWLATNSLPQINNSDYGIWRRIMAIPFNRTFSVEEQDKTLQSKLVEELPGILNWAIQGCLEWQREGLNPPKIVQDQVAEYKSSMDSISQFIKDECDIGVDCSHSASQFYSEYRSWCLAVGKKPKNQTAFKRALEATKGVYQKRTAKGNTWFGIQPCLMV
jgi:putative DNA primase/helicase